MKKGEAVERPAATRTPRPRRRASSETPPAARIHPVIIYPFRPTEDYTDLGHLYDLVGEMAAEPGTYARPITVIDRKTHGNRAADPRYREFRASRVERHSDVLDAWCVDTCQMWYAGLGQAYEQGGPDDVYWLIPGDFNYGSPAGREVLQRLSDLPAICDELAQDICVGEILTEPGHSKQLIDTHGTFALLYNWFPEEAREIRQYTERPRSEFFAIRHEFLGEMLNRRWYAYEQTVVLLLHAVFSGRHITRFSVGNISDLPGGREGLASAIQQVERTERVLKTLWRERHGARPDWPEHYRRLEAQSEQIRRAALIILEKMLA
jgi:hypothetical protein